MRRTNPLIAPHQKRISDSALEEFGRLEVVEAQVQTMYLSLSSPIFSP
jgi:hypothetical protein